MVVGFVDGQDPDIFRFALADTKDAVNSLHHGVYVKVWEEDDAVADSLKVDRLGRHAA